MPFLYNDPLFRERRRTLRSGQTDAEKFLWRRLRNKQLKGQRFLRQYGVAPYILDFYCPNIRLAIELDGGQHLEEDKRIYDAERTRFLESNDISVLRFWNNEVMKNINGVLEAIDRAVTPSNSPLR